MNLHKDASLQYSLRKILSEITVTACEYKTGLVACGVRRLIREIALISTASCEASDRNAASFVQMREKLLECQSASFCA